MRATSHAPSARLAPYVRELVIVETDGAAESALLPEPGLVIGLRYRGAAAQLDASGLPQRLADASITGVTGALRRVRTAPGGGIVVAKLRTEGAAGLLAVPLHELYGATAPLDALLPRAEVARALEQLAEARTAADRLAAVEAFLWARRRADSPDLLVARAVGEIRRTGGRVRIRELAAQLGTSQDPLEKRFRRAVGASPKQLASIERLRAAVAAYRPGASLARLAYESGYYDQSHMNRDFRAVTGEAPERFLRGAGFW